MHVSRRALLGAGAAGVAVLSGCASGTTGAPVVSTPVAPQTASERLTATLDRTVAAILHEQPERCTSLGLTEARAGYRFIDKLSDASKDGARRNRAIVETAVNELHAIDRSGLSPQELVTLDTVTTAYQNNLANSRFEIGGGAGAPYVVTQLTGSYREFPDFMDNQHPLRSRDDADAFLAR